MSWFIGILAKHQFESRSSIEDFEKTLKKVVNKEPRLKIRNEKMLIWGDGIDDTFKFKLGDDSGWVVCGIGIGYDGNSFSIMDETSWDEAIGNGVVSDRICKMNGHFAGLIWKGNRIELMCDALELRRVYVTELQDHFVVSTRLDWLTLFMEAPAFDLGEFAGTWMLVNSFSDNAILGNVIRAGASGAIKIEGDKLIHRWHPWMPDGSVESDSIRLLEEATLMPIESGHQLSLGLSGGMDSRTLLSILTKAPKEFWRTHSCGDANNIDVAVARQLAEQLNVRHSLRVQKISSQDTVDSVVESLREYALSTEMSDSIFGYSRLELFSELHREKCWMIDGGFGELLRRSYGNKLFLSGRKAVVERNARALLPYFYHPRSSIFNDDIINLLKRESEKQLQESATSMPENPQKDIGNWIDLLHIRYRLKNYPANGQAMYDEHIAAYMPFAQQAVISSYLKTPSRRRKNDILNRRIISMNGHDLDRYPLVSSGTLIPYWTSRHILISRIWGVAQKKISPHFDYGSNSFRNQVLHFLKEFILDRMKSEKIRTSPFYRYSYLEQSAERFYSDSSGSQAQVLEDWLVFDFWRELLDQKNGVVRQKEKDTRYKNG